jgi:hypothetical protein
MVFDVPDHIYNALSTSNIYPFSHPKYLHDQCDLSDDTDMWGTVSQSQPDQVIGKRLNGQCA